METSPAFTTLTCVDCDTSVEPRPTGRCPECGGILDPTYDLSAVELDRGALQERHSDSMWRYGELLPFPSERAVTMGEGGTPVLECPTLAEEMGVETVLIKDEGHNPTGTFKDRGQTVAVTGARVGGAESVALASAGNAGQAAAAYAARAGLDAHVFLPSRAGFTKKAMVNVHGAELTVVEGRIGDAGGEFAAEMESHEEWVSLQTFETPYRHEGKKTMFYEIAEQRDFSSPDAIVYPTGGGVGLVGMYKGAQEFRDLGFVEELPAFYAAQSSGCAPVVRAFEEGQSAHDIWEQPDTICGGIEIPDPGASHWILEALRETDGGAVATDDDDILEAAITVAQAEGVEMVPTAAAAASGAIELAEQGAFDADDTVVIVNTGAGNKEADVLRSHLMGQGI
ncbi:MAG: threonine synthase [Halodesulfurarchaeum sp.]